VIDGHGEARPFDLVAMAVFFKLRKKRLEVGY
jgi:hypothetical protein